MAIVGIFPLHLAGFRRQEMLQHPEEVFNPTPPGPGADQARRRAPRLSTHKEKDMAVKNEQATYQELHVSYPDESITETIYQFVYDDIIKRIPKDNTVVDIGCGIGTLASRIAGFSKEVIGIDIAPERIERAKAIHNVDNLKFYVADAYNLPLESKSVDVIVSVGAFHHLDLEKIVPEMKRVLRKGGIIFIIDIYEGFQKPSARIKSWLRMLKRDGPFRTFSTFVKMLPMYFREKNRQHRKNDKERMIKMNKYSFKGFSEEHSKYLKGCVCGEDIFPWVYCYYVHEED
jgi:ubiquinone/menaquinone biosynthesis C-methylase UbiE